MGKSGRIIGNRTVIQVFCGTVSCNRAFSKLRGEDLDSMRGEFCLLRLLCHFPFEVECDTFDEIAVWVHWLRSHDNFSVFP
jgi:hypothetical protein